MMHLGICKDDNDLIKPGRITMKPTTEQHLVLKHSAGCCYQLHHACHAISLILPLPSSSGKSSFVPPWNIMAPLLKVKVSYAFEVSSVYTFYIIERFDGNRRHRG